MCVSFSLSTSGLKLWPTKNMLFPPCSLQGIHMEITRLKTTTAIRGTSTLMWKTTRSILIIQSLIHYSLGFQTHSIWVNFLHRHSSPTSDAHFRTWWSRCQTLSLICISQLTSERCWTWFVQSVRFFALTNRRDAKFTLQAAQFPHEKHYIFILSQAESKKQRIANQQWEKVLCEWACVGLYCLRFILLLVMAGLIIKCFGSEKAMKMAG